jgi:hypothetical protein
VPGGRPSKLTPEIAERIVAAVGVGAPLRLAAAHGGIGERTLHRWLAAGEQSSRGAYRQFWQRVEAARAGYFVEMGEIVKTDAVADARTALAAMGRLYAADLAPPKRVEVSGELQIRDDEAALRVLLLDRDWCERTQEILATQPGDNGAHAPLHSDR